jgi:hypothetical protein
VVDEDAAHDLRGDGVEVRAALPPGLRAVLPGEPQVRLVDERRRLERVARPLAAHLPARDAAQLGVDERGQPVERRGVAPAPVREQLRDLLRRNFSHAHSPVPRKLPAQLIKRADCITTRGPRRAATKKISPGVDASRPVRRIQE